MSKKPDGWATLGSDVAAVRAEREMLPSSTRTMFTVFPAPGGHGPRRAGSRAGRAQRRPVPADDERN